MGSHWCCSILLYSSFSHIKGQIQLVVNKQEISEIHGPRMSDYLRNMAKWSGGHLVFC